MYYYYLISFIDASASVSSLMSLSKMSMMSGFCPGFDFSRLIVAMRCVNAFESCCLLISIWNFAICSLLCFEPLIYKGGFCYCKVFISGGEAPAEPLLWRASCGCGTLAVRRCFAESSAVVYHGGYLMASYRQSNHQHAFAQVPDVQINRSRFDRSHGMKTTMDAGWLVPIFVDEVLPGDTFSLRATYFARLATPLHPFMDNVFLETFFFFVPNRLLWTNFKRFFGEQDNPADSTSYLVPQITSPGGGYGEMSVYDYMGLPTKIAGLPHNALHPRAYNLIYNTWFRDQNLQNSVTVNLGDGPDAPGDVVLLRRGKRHDYFTSALPWPQKGPAVNIPLGGNAPVLGLSIGVGDNAANQGVASMGVIASADGTTSMPAWRADTNTTYVRSQTTGVPHTTTNRPQVFADLSSATAATINQLRQAFQVQKIYERDARGGTRYTELIQAHFGVTSPDARLQRPEYLGGGSTPVNVNPIAQTSNTPASGTPQGNLAAMGTAMMHGVGFSKGFTEHGVIIGLVSARADMNYQDGMNRMWSRQTRFDYYWPALQAIGEQAVLNQEIYAVGTGGAGRAQDLATFGYQERYAEYRYKPSMITGLFRSNAAAPLDSWHLGVHFTSLPSLNATFIVEDPPIDRVIAVPAEPHFLLDAYFQLSCARPMPVYSVPGNIDRF